MELENILLIVILCFLILYTIIHIKINPQPPPPPYPVVGGCAGTIYGCCPDNMTPKRDMNGSNCYYHPPSPYPPSPYPIPPHPPLPPNPNPQPVVGGCAGTRYGCCPDNVTAKNDNMGGACPLPTQQNK